MMAERLKEFIGITMIGDGLLGVIDPQGHIGLWRSGPEPWQKMMDGFISHPQATQLFGAVELALGVWLAKRQMPTSPRQRPPHARRPVMQREFHT